jgi:hypothetical protein
MVGIIASVGIVVAGLYLTISQNDSEMGMLGAMLLVLGLTFLGVNFYMHRHGFRMRRRRR